MNIAVIAYDDVIRNMQLFEQDAVWLDPERITDTDFGRFSQIYVLGNLEAISKPSRLSSRQIKALWLYVSQGGTLYAELIEAWDFPSSRLFGWKQEYRWSIRTAERLRVMTADGVLQQGQLLEWAGPFAKGFRVYGESWLNLGPYKSTKTCESDEGVMEAPGLVVHRKGAGAVVYAAFPLLQSAEPWARRPYAEWGRLYDLLRSQAGLELSKPKPVIETTGPQQRSEALRRTAEWFLRSGIMPAADGSSGIYENVHSITAAIYEDRRPDCHAHAALFFHLYGKYTGDARWERISKQLLSTILDGNYQDLDPASATYGFFKWYDFPEMQPDQIFSDDNAWVCLILLYLYRQTANPLYKERGMLTAQAMLATQQEDGLRANCLIGGDLRELGLAKGANTREASGNPHFESIAHAAFIQAYLVSRRECYLDTAMKGSLALLERFDHLNLLYSRTSGVSRFVLPLTYLEKHDSTGKIRQGLDAILTYLRQHRHECGAIEEADNPDPDKYMKEDTGVFRYNGEGIADLLYTNNFLAINLWEGWKQSGRESFHDLAQGVADFLSAAQIRSENPRFDGGWMRAFDVNLGEYFGNNGDTGWGPYCMESGWTEALIGSGLLLQEMNMSLFDEKGA